MNWYFGADPIDAYTEYLEIEGFTEEVFAEIKKVFEFSGWVHEQGDGRLVQ